VTGEAAVSEVPPRLSILLAASAPVAVVLRRGPTDWVQVTKWDTSRDTFDDGAWFHGHIYPERSGLSPDGRLMVYFACKHQWLHTDPCWTAISRPPWLTALAMWPQMDAMHGGGYFEKNSSVVLTTLFECDPHPDHQPHGLTVRFGRRAPQQAQAEVPDADWSGYDQQNRLIYARRGRLFRMEGLTLREIADFGDRSPDPVPAPAWARRWPGR
jgi:hypothetical protein